MKTAADLFCGAGGTTTGLLLAAGALALRIDVLAINHWNLAIETHLANHPQVRHLCETLDNVDPRKVIPAGRLDILVGSPECTHHSIARGGLPCSDQSRASAWHICRWAEALQPENILIENVKEFQSWGPLTRRGKRVKRLKGKTFAAFIAAISSLGYAVEWRELNCADFGDATTRERLFIIARRNKPIQWPAPSHSGNWRAAAEIIDWSIKGTSIFNRKRPLSSNTLRRIEAGFKMCGGKPFIVHLCHAGGPRVRPVSQPLPTITCAHRGELALIEPFIIKLRGTSPAHLKSSAQAINKPLPTVTPSGNHLALVEPFLIKYYGTGTAIPVSKPLPTITGHDRFGLIEPQHSGARLDFLFRMLQPHELAAATSFPTGYKFAGNRGDQVKQIGNAVPVRTAAALCNSLLS